MIRDNFVGSLICVGVLVGGVGCGDADPADGAYANVCEAACGAADECPNLYYESDCVAECENAKAQAEVIGGTCPAAMEAQIACHAGLSCQDLFGRATSSSPSDECVQADAEVQNCVADVDPTDQGDRPADELTLACDGLCNAIDACPTTYAEPSCLQECLAAFGSAQNGSATCSSAVIDAVNCQAGMSCSEIENRVRGVSAFDSCRSVDNEAVAICSVL
jgi:hypothetical protein